MLVVAIGSLQLALRNITVVIALEPDAGACLLPAKIVVDFDRVCSRFDKLAVPHELQIIPEILTAAERRFSVPSTHDLRVGIGIGAWVSLCVEGFHLEAIRTFCPSRLAIAADRNLKRLIALVANVPMENDILAEKVLRLIKL